MTTRFRVASTKLEEIHTGASFLPGEEAPGFDPNDPDDARKLEEGLFVAIQEPDTEPTPDAVDLAEKLGVDLGKVAGSGANSRVTKADVQKAHDDQEKSK